MCNVYVTGISKHISSMVSCLVPAPSSNVGVATRVASQRSFIDAGRARCDLKIAVVNVCKYTKDSVYTKACIFWIVGNEEKTKFSR